jgi:peptide/nickel transport system permease protein
MTEYILRRILLVIPVMLGVSLLVFASIRIVPGDAVDVLLAERFGRDEKLIADLRAQLGLDRPGPEQYVRWMSQVVRGDLGNSLINKRPVGDQIRSALPVTFELLIISVIVGVLIAIPGGVLAAVRQDRWLDYILRITTVGFISIPNFVIASLLVLMPALWFRYAPPPAYVAPWSDPLRNLQQFIFPGLALGIGFSATLLRMTRSSMLEVLREDYVRTAWAKGLRERVVVFRHALKNAMIPPITVIGSNIATLIGGTVIIENIFNLPGLGRLTLDSIGNRDYTQLQGNVLFIAFTVVMINLVVDISYAWFDPRIRYG